MEREEGAGQRGNRAWHRKLQRATNKVGKLRRCFELSLMKSDLHCTSKQGRGRERRRKGVAEGASNLFVKCQLPARATDASANSNAIRECTKEAQRDRRRQRNCNGSSEGREGVG